MPVNKRSTQLSRPSSPADTAVMATSRRASDLAAPTAALGDYQASWQQAHDTLEAALELGNTILNGLKDGQQRASLNQFIDAISNVLTALNREDMQNRTLSLQAATGQLSAGIASLKVLRQQITQISDTFADAAKVVAVIDGVLSGLQSFLAAFPAL